MALSPRHFRPLQNLTTGLAHLCNDNGDTALFDPRGGIPAVADILRDDYRDMFYLVRQVQPVHGRRGRISHYTATLQTCNVTCTIQRFQEGDKDAFGRELDPNPAPIAYNIHGYLSYTGPETIRMVTPDIQDIRPNDRITATDLNGDSHDYRVIALDHSNPGFLIYLLEKDHR